MEAACFLTVSAGELLVLTVNPITFLATGSYSQRKFLILKIVYSPGSLTAPTTFKSFLILPLNVRHSQDMSIGHFTLYMLTDVISQPQQHLQSYDTKSITQS